jgi:hypothetical protein
MNALAREPELSVVLTLMDDRGRTAECLSSWTHGQTFPRERFEVIVVTSGREPEVEARASPVLTAGDRLLRCAASNELALHDFGARQARGKWLLFTEAHCVAQPACLAELMAYLQEHKGQVAGACIRTLSDESLDRVARLEERWYREGFAAWSRETDWRKVTIRGTAVRREAYEKVGGFKSEFGCFGEIFLAAELHASGYRLGYVPAAAVKHYNSTKLHEVLSYIREYRVGELLCQSRYSSGLFETYFGWPQTRAEAGSTDGGLALRCAALSLLQAMAHPLRKGSLALAQAMLAVLGQQAVQAATFGRAAVLQSAAAYIWWRVLFAWPWLDEDERYRRFCRLWEETGELARQQALLRQKSAAERHSGSPSSAAFEYQPAVGPSTSFSGFHARERFDGQAFRWSGCLALVRVAVPRGDYEVRLDTNGVRDCRPAGLVACYLNGRRMPRVNAATARQIAFRADSTMFNAGMAQVLVLTAGRLRTSGRAERRALGIPVLAIRFVPRGPAPSVEDAPQPPAPNE